MHILLSLAFDVIFYYLAFLPFIPTATAPIVLLFPISCRPSERLSPYHHTYWYILHIIIDLDTNLSMELSYIPGCRMARLGSLGRYASIANSMMQARQYDVGADILQSL